MKKEGRVVVLLSIISLMIILVVPYIYSATFTCDGSDGKKVEYRCSTSGAGCASTVYDHTECKCGGFSAWGCQSSSSCASGYNYRVDKGSCGCDWTCNDKFSAVFCIGYLAYVNRTNATTCGGSYNNCNYASTSETIRAPTSDYLCACKPYTGIRMNNKTTMKIDIGQSLTYYYNLTNVSKLTIKWTDEESSKRANIYLGNVVIGGGDVSTTTKTYSDIFKIANNLRIVGSGTGKNITVYEVNITGTCMSNCSQSKALTITCGQVVPDGCGCPCNFNGTKCNTGEFCDSDWTCKPLTQPIGKPYWTNTLLVPINKTNVSDTVFMNVPGQGIEEKFINYTIKKFGDLSWNPLNWFQHTILQTSTLGISDWNVSELGTFYFKAKVDSSENESNNLEALAYENTKPVVVWDAPDYTPNPVTGVAYLAAEVPISFDQSSYDPDDLLKITWDFGDGTTNQVFNDYSRNYTPEYKHTTHTYTDGGKYVNVELIAKEMNRDQSDSETHEFYVLKEGINVVPVISSPKNMKSFDGYWVNFNASATHVLNCTQAPCKGPGGNCPVTDIEEHLYCFYEHAPFQRTAEGYDLIFNWRIFTIGESTIISRIGNINLNYSQVVEFPEIFDSANMHGANLTVIYRK